MKKWKKRMYCSEIKQVVNRGKMRLNTLQKVANIWSCQRVNFTVNFHQGFCNNKDRECSTTSGMAPACSISFKTKSIISTNWRNKNNQVQVNFSATMQWRQFQARKKLDLWAEILMTNNKWSTRRFKKRAWSVKEVNCLTLVIIRWSTSFSGKWGMLSKKRNMNLLQVWQTQTWFKA